MDLENDIGNAARIVLPNDLENVPGIVLQLEQSQLWEDQAPRMFSSVI